MSLDQDTDLQVRVQAMLDNCEVANIRLVDFSAKLVGGGEASTGTVSSETSYLVDEKNFANRYVWRVDLTDEVGEAVAELAATIVVEYAVAEGFVPDEPAADAIAETTGYFASYPYAREIFQSNTTRLQLNPIVLGMLLHGATHPRAITVPKAARPSEDGGSGNRASN